MKGKQTALYPGNEDKVGYWLTPPELMEKLEAEFHFNFDACPYPRPDGFDGLKEEWGPSTWCNPPIDGKSSFSAWVHKAILENQKGKTVVIVLPMLRWFRNLVLAGAEIRPLGAVPWMNPQGKRIKSDGGGHYPDTLFILRGNGSTRNNLKPGEIEK